MQRRLATADRIVAWVLALIWTGAGGAALIAGWVLQRWDVGLAAALALGFAALWLRVAVRGRLLGGRTRGLRPPGNRATR